MPKADATGLAPKNRLDPSEAHRSGGVFLWLHSLVEPPSGGLGLKNAKDRRAAFARRSELSFRLISPVGPAFACDRWPPLSRPARRAFSANNPCRRGRLRPDAWGDAIGWAASAEVVPPPLWAVLDTPRG